MRSRARERRLVLGSALALVAIVVATSGCGILKKKKKKVDPDSTGDTSSLTGDFTAVNKAQIIRFADEQKILAEPGFVRQLATVRTAPNEGGDAVGVIDPDKLVTKFATRSGYTLVTFDRVGAQIGTKWAGWIPDAAFSSTAPMPGAAATATAAAVAGTVAAKPTATVAGINTVGTATINAAPTATGLPETGTCRLTLRSTSFSPSSSGCEFNEKVRGNTAALVFPCAGGTARAAFGSQLFSGTADRNKISVSHSEVFKFQNCTVLSTQSITGTPPNLAYSYSERITSSGCKALPCTARGTISAVQ
jgi:hypothetical protein